MLLSQYFFYNLHQRNLYFIYLKKFIWHTPLYTCICILYKLLLGGYYGCLKVFTSTEETSTTLSIFTLSLSVCPTKATIKSRMIYVQQLQPHAQLYRGHSHPSAAGLLGSKVKDTITHS